MFSELSSPLCWLLPASLQPRQHSVDMSPHPRGLSLFDQGHVLAWSSDRSPLFSEPNPNPPTKHRFRVWGPFHGHVSPKERPLSLSQIPVPPPPLRLCHCLQRLTLSKRRFREFVHSSGLSENKKARINPGLSFADARDPRRCRT